MQWLLALEIENDPISVCRLMNNFRRKGVRLAALWLTSSNSGFDGMALVETSESEVDHLFHFLRRSEGVEHVSAYLPVPLQNERESDLEQHGTAVSYVLVKGGYDTIESPPLANLAGSKVVFASQGKYLFEVSREAQARVLGTIAATSGEWEFVHFAPMRTTRSQAVSEMVA